MTEEEDKVTEPVEVTELEDKLPCPSALLDSGSESEMTEEEDGSSFGATLLLSSSSHAANTTKMDPIAAMRLQDDSTKNFFIKNSAKKIYLSNR
jgi:hypothetical protein